ncbi:GNAT family N-acetyltransferase [Roseivivax sp. CAU 1761]
MTAAEMAALMQRAYRHQTAWSEAALEATLAQPSTRLFLAPDGFLLAQAIADEAEILALATAPAAQRNGVASALLERFHAGLASEGAARVLLEVAADNAPARALYARHGYCEEGRRRGYYRRASGPAADALILARSLTPSHAEATAMTPETG